MKRTITIFLSAILLLATVGCSCGLSCCAKSQVPTPPENAAFTLAYDDASIPVLLAYFQANTGYQPTFVNVTDSGSEDTEAEPAVLASSACIAVLKEEANVAVLEQAGWTRMTLDNVFELIVLEAPSTSSAVRNTDAVSALKVWFGGAEAQYLFAHPDLLQ